jgi:hypothetical protein
MAAAPRDIRAALEEVGLSNLNEATLSKCTLSVSYQLGLPVVVGPIVERRNDAFVRIPYVFLLLSLFPRCWIGRDASREPQSACGMLGSL